MLPLLLPLLLAPALAQVTFDGKCPAPAVQAAFNAAEAGKFAGVTWYEHARYYSWLEDSDVCTTWKYTLVDDTNMVLESVTDMQTKKGNSRTMKSQYTQKNIVSEEAKFYYKVLEKPGSGHELIGTYDYEIISTDSATVAIAWSCKDKTFGNHEEMLWIMTNAPDSTMTDISDAIAAAEGQGLIVDMNKLFFVDQTDATCGTRP